MQYKLTTPCTAEELAKLRAGDTVLLSGVVYTARDQAHKRMLEALDKGEPLPFPLEGSAIYYVGPTPERPGEVIGSAGPTTSGRMDAMSPRLLDLGNKVMIGKGKRDAAVKEAVRRNGAVYLAALGGAGALMAKSVKTLEVIAWPDLGCEAVRRLTVEDMEEIRKTQELMGRKEWIYGRMPQHTEVRKLRLPDVGSVEVYLEIKDGKILDLNLVGDFFIMGDVDGEIIAPLRHQPFTREGVAAALQGHDLSQVVRGLTTEGWLQVLFG